MTKGPRPWRAGVRGAVRLGTSLRSRGESSWRRGTRLPGKKLTPARLADRGLRSDDDDRGCEKGGRGFRGHRWRRSRRRPHRAAHLGFSSGAHHAVDWFGYEPAAHRRGTVDIGVATRVTERTAIRARKQLTSRRGTSGRKMTISATGRSLRRAVGTHRVPPGVTRGWRPAWALGADQIRRCVAHPHLFGSSPSITIPSPWTAALRLFTLLVGDSKVGCGVDPRTFNGHRRCCAVCTLTETEIAASPSRKCGYQGISPPGFETLCRGRRSPCRHRFRRRCGGIRSTFNGGLDEGEMNGVSKAAATGSGRAVGNESRSGLWREQLSRFAYGSSLSRLSRYTPADRLRASSSCRGLSLLLHLDQ